MIRLQIQMIKWARKVFKDHHAEDQAQGPGKEAGLNSKRKPVSADNPIRSAADDSLQRTPLAQSFAKQILSLDVAEGIVVAVLGPWGSGKTSFVNISRTYLEKAGATVLDFNPWMFSGTEQLVDAFFNELSAQLKLRPGLDEVGKSIEEYGETFSGLAWLPLVGPWIERGKKATNILAKILQRRKEGVAGRRSKVEKALAALSMPIVVVVDDLDRLNTSEIRDIFKLVRLTANFPNVVYLLAFDRGRVEDALTEQGIRGRDYLEKILQVGLDIPAVPVNLLTTQVLQAIERALSDIENPGPFDENRWPDILMEVIRPLVRNMRDVRRYAAGVHGSVYALDGRVAATDVLALEAIRIFLPDVLLQFNSLIDALTTTFDIGYARQGDALQAQINRLLEAAAPRAEIVRSLIKRLFPAAERYIGDSHFGNDWRRQWLREKRVAHEDIFRFYMERVVGEKLQNFADADQAWQKMDDASAFATFLRSLDINRLRDVIGSLEMHEDEFRREHVVPGTVVLLNLSPELPEVKGSIFKIASRFAVRRMVYKLLKSLSGSDAIEKAVCDILPQVERLSGKLELISIVGHREGVGHKLVSEDAAREFQKQWRDEVRKSSGDLLAKNKDLLEILLMAKTEVQPDESPMNIPQSTDVTLALLRSARGEVQSQAMDSRSVRTSARLAWDQLIVVYGEEDILRARIEELKAEQPLADPELMVLVDRYLSGWRPKMFEDD